MLTGMLAGVTAVAMPLARASSRLRLSRARRIIARCRVMAMRHNSVAGMGGWMCIRIAKVRLLGRLLEKFCLLGIGGAACVRWRDLEGAVGVAW